MARIFLIGYMGAGKTTLGKPLAQQMQLSFIDLDHFIENRYRQTVGQLFASKGEAYFREIEHNMLCEVSQFENCVISTGGGAPCFHNNMELMNQHGIVVYLTASVKELAARVAASKTVRPILQGKSEEALRQFIDENLTARAPFYNQAQIHFRAEMMSSKAQIASLVDTLQKSIEMQLKEE